MINSSGKSIWIGWVCFFCLAMIIAAPRLITQNSQNEKEVEKTTIQKLEDLPTLEELTKKLALEGDAKAQADYGKMFLLPPWQCDELALADTTFSFPLGSIISHTIRSLEENSVLKTE